jgi:Fur family transcriptional regulator, ferric uptake regulator
MLDVLPSRRLEPEGAPACGLQLECVTRYPHGVAENLSPVEIRALLRRAGLKSTAARAAVYDRLQRATAPVAHAELADALASKGFDRATIYRNLVDLAEAGLARRSDVGDHVWRYELARANDHQAGHPHFVCSDCGEIECLPEVDLRFARGARPPRAVGRHLVEIQLKGLCDACLPAAER